MPLRTIDNPDAGFPCADEDGGYVPPAKREQKVYALCLQSPGDNLSSVHPCLLSAIGRLWLLQDIILEQPVENDHCSQGKTGR